MCAYRNISTHKVEYGTLGLELKQKICRWNHPTLSFMTIKSSNYRPPDKSVYWKIIFLFLNQNIWCRYSKEPSQ